MVFMLSISYTDVRGFGNIKESIVRKSWKFEFGVTNGRKRGHLSAGVDYQHYINRR